MISNLLTVNSNRYPSGSFGSFLTNARTAKELSQDRLGARVNKSGETIRLWESDNYKQIPPNALMVRYLAVALCMICVDTSKQACDDYSLDYEDPETGEGMAFNEAKNCGDADALAFACTNQQDCKELIDAFICDYLRKGKLL